MILKNALMNLVDASSEFTTDEVAADREKMEVGVKKLFEWVEKQPEKNVGTSLEHYISTKNNDNFWHSVAELQVNNAFATSKFGDWLEKMLNLFTEEWNDHDAERNPEEELVRERCIMVARIVFQHLRATKYLSDLLDEFFKHVDCRCKQTVAGAGCMTMVEKIFRQISKNWKNEKFDDTVQADSDEETEDGAEDDSIEEEEQEEEQEEDDDDEEEEDYQEEEEEEEEEEAYQEEDDDDDESYDAKRATKKRKT